MKRPYLILPVCLAVLVLGGYVFAQQNVGDNLSTPYNPANVLITGGTINGVTLGNTFPIPSATFGITNALSTAINLNTTSSASWPEIQIGSGSTMNWISFVRGWVGYNSGTNNVELGAVTGKNLILTVGAPAATMGGGTVNATLTTTSFQVPGLSTNANCTSAASPAVCAAAPSGSVSVAAAATTEVVNTTAVTANSQIQLTFDSSLGTKLALTCNTTPVQPTVSARTAATSFTITVPAAPTTNPACFSYTVIN